MKNTPLTDCKGVGPKTAELFLKIGVSSQEELLRFYPRDYDLFSDPVLPDNVIPGEKNAVFCRLTAKPSVKRFGGSSITMVRIRTGNGILQINWFRMPYLKNTLQPGREYIFRGIVTEKEGRRILQHPEVYDPDEYARISRRLLPVYPLTEGLSQNTVRRVMKTVLAGQRDPEEILPEELLEEEHLPGIAYALQMIHFPEDAEALVNARRRLVFEEFFLFQLGVALLRETRYRDQNTHEMPAADLTGKAEASLPYKLTNAQKRVLDEIQTDLNRPYLMRRMVQGDVGSGKTILAFLSMVRAYENGWQSALMAPTDVLATQHYNALCRFLERSGIEGVHPVLLKGSLTAKARRETEERIVSGGAGMVIGTHALFQDAVKYERLGLVITDEQHRFGVRQRARFSKKGDLPHVLVMSATPIPRTLSMILFGDLDLSVLDEVPAKRLPIRNCVVDTGYREAAYRFMEKEIARGHQAYVVCPAISPGEGDACENVEEYSSMLQKRFQGKIRVGTLHGKMKNDEKQEIMDLFAEGVIQVLVSTTVIEVGVDVPNATLMLIENAERFGLAQLHQIRGRVGRGDAQSYCIFMQGDGKEETVKRLDILNQSNDGFRIAEEDLRLRGPGDLFGVRQSGLALFAIADIYRDAEILKHADHAARRILEQDPDLGGEVFSGIRKYLKERQFGQIDCIS